MEDQSEMGSASSQLMPYQEHPALLDSVMARKKMNWACLIEALRSLDVVERRRDAGVWLAVQSWESVRGRLTLLMNGLMKLEYSDRTHCSRIRMSLRTYLQLEVFAGRIAE